MRERGGGEVEENMGTSTFLSICRGVPGELDSWLCWSRFFHWNAECWHLGEQAVKHLLDLQSLFCSAVKLLPFASNVGSGVGEPLSTLLLAQRQQTSMFLQRLQLYLWPLTHFSGVALADLLQSLTLFSFKAHHNVAETSSLFTNWWAASSSLMHIDFL